MNILDEDNIQECTGCQFCAAVCPKQAISVNLNDYGFYRPSVNGDKCVDCGECKTVCYKYSKIPIYEDVDKLINYAAYAKDDEIVENSTSGGIGDLLCEQLISEGYICIGVEYETKRNIAVDKIAYNREDCVSFRGSKYVQSYTYDAFKEMVVSHLNEKVAVFGTPCHIYAIDQYLKKKHKRDNYVLIDIYCHGCPSMIVWKKYIEFVKSKTNEAIFDHVNFRSKIYGWGNYYVVKIVKGGKSIFTSPKINDMFYALFFSDVLLNNSCYDCQLRSTIEYTDIRIGDFWGKKYIKNSKGVSLVTINPSSQKGKELFKNIQTKIVCFKHPSSDCIPYQSWGRHYSVEVELREKLFMSLKNSSQTIEDTVRLYWQNRSFIINAKHKLKNMVLMMPRFVVSFFKSII